jgi:hypothetical protein
MAHESSRSKRGQVQENMCFARRHGRCSVEKLDVYGAPVDYGRRSDCRSRARPLLWLFRWWPTRPPSGPGSNIGFAIGGDKVGWTRRADGIEEVENTMNLEIARLKLFVGATLVVAINSSCGGVDSINPNETGGTANGGAANTGGGNAGGTGGVDGASCCANDADCVTSAPPCVLGECRGALSYPGCWRDADCGNDEICSGISMCPCGAECYITEKSGTCVPAHAGCCVSDADCANGGECVAGVCKQRPPSGTCWSNSDCPGGNCEIPHICSCPRSCFAPDTAGTCVPWHTL